MALAMQDASLAPDLAAWLSSTHPNHPTSYFMRIAGLATTGSKFGCLVILGIDHPGADRFEWPWSRSFGHVAAVEWCDSERGGTGYVTGGQDDGRREAHDERDGRLGDDDRGAAARLLEGPGDEGGGGEGGGEYEGGGLSAFVTPG